MLQTNVKKIIIGCDHGGYELKLEVIKHLTENGIDVVDVGTNSTASCNYPDYAHALCKKIQDGEAPCGILICGTGIGMSMTANKHRGIRAALCGDTFSAEKTRQHNNANVLCMGARVIGPGLALDIVDAFLNATFEGGRHETRIAMLEQWMDQ